MNQVAVLLDELTLYRSSIVLSLAMLTGLCLFLCCCAHAGIGPMRASLTAALGVVLGLLGARLLYWNCRADSFDSLRQALTVPDSGSFALAGAFLGCGLAALLTGGRQLEKLLESMSLSACGAIALGRLGHFFTSSDRGRIVQELKQLPFAYPVLNRVTGLPEYRLAVFLFQAALAGVLFAVLVFRFFRGREITLHFLLTYCAGQVIFDSMRYDSLYLRINGFVSVVQILAAVGLAASLVLLSVRTVRATGRKRGYPALWLVMTALFAAAGYMEYYVQRHGSEAVFAYSVMGACLFALVLLGWAEELFNA